MRIAKVTEDKIIFNNGNYIWFDHCSDCCEWNYADFSILTKNTVNYDYDFNEDLDFKFIEELGFCFGSDGRWIFIPCYSEQNGYYSTDIDIYYYSHQKTRNENIKPVLNGLCAFVYR